MTVFLPPFNSHSPSGQADKSDIATILFYHNKEKAENFYKEGCDCIVGSKLYVGEYSQDQAEKAVICFQKAVELGHSEAYVKLGRCYQLGRGGVKKNLQIAIRIYSQLKKNNPYARRRLAECYEEGLGVGKNKKKAAKNYFKAAWGYERNGKMEKAFKIYQKAANNGHLGAKLDLAICYEEGKGIEKDEKEAVRIYQDLAALDYWTLVDNKISLVLQRLSKCYSQGKGVTRDDDKALRLECEYLYGAHTNPRPVNK